MEPVYTIGETLFTEKEIAARVDGLAGRIASETPGNELLAVGILNGAAIFLSDLVRRMPPELDVRMDFMSVSGPASGSPAGAGAGS
jgi:hypoxanthine phosphoribosyltransferase